ncbi:hypothetical protein ABH935_006742 [Catenulispora sp. GAS73]|uniref:hypothetical protein n=1 Tax=Catenulispora sp. GAS73 TaxID=3156269 RepID=UPI003513CE61
MTGLATWALNDVVSRAELGAFDRAISEHTGQSIAIHPLIDHPGWLAKLYRQPRPRQDSQRLDALITAPATLDESDRRTLLSSSSWPAARITEAGNPVVGCVIPAAPERFKADLTVGRTTVSRHVEVDWLAKTDEALRGVGLRAPGDSGRITACRNLAALAEMLEKLGLVYSDWSYSNAFWSPADRSVFVIDIDGCQTGKMPNFQQPSWTDPLTPSGGDADVYTDRFRVALLVARCLTAKRRTDDAIAAVAGQSLPDHPAVRNVLLDMLLASDRERRPSIGQLRLALSGGPYIRPQPQPAWLAMPGVPGTPGLPGAKPGVPGPGTRSEVTPQLTPASPGPQPSEFVPFPVRPTSVKPQGPNRRRAVVGTVAAAVLITAIVMLLILHIVRH